MVSRIRARESCRGISIGENTDAVRKSFYIFCSLFDILCPLSVEERNVLIRKEHLSARCPALIYAAGLCESSH